MLTSTFVFLQGIGPATERRWWQEGLLDWRSFLTQPCVAGLSPDRKSWYDRELALAQSEFDAGHLHVFASRLQSRDHWRFYDTCRSSTVYLDIETTGASPHDGEVTVVGLHRNGRTTSLVRGETLTADRLQAELDQCKLLVTFFGAGFDVPYLRATFPRLRLPKPHFDLCFAARRLGLRGGLKHIEQEVGIERDPALRGLDGWDAVQLWSQWHRGDRAALDLLLAYNAADTENLVPLAAFVYKEMMSRFGPSSVGPSSSLTPIHTALPR
ncbi:MAG: ribonuclease H-like domain-containing protein [Nitrospirae bacterium]|nr:ribonuclease H-like domain-containing protein [Nitrospirota bacterium]